MALTALQVRQCLMILFPEPSWSNNATGAAVAGAHEAEARAVLAAIDASQETIVGQILTAWDDAVLDESSISATSTNKGFSTSGRKARKLLRSQLVSVLGYDPTPGYGTGFGVGRG